jgi:hypothetical protein
VAPAVSRVEGGQSFTVEPGDQVGHRVAAAAAGGSGGPLVVGAVSDSQEDDGPGDAIGRLGATAAQAGQLLALVIGQGAKRVLPSAGHGNSPGEAGYTQDSRGKSYGHGRGK